jgi:ferredoxin-nitrate reductase
MKRAAAVFRSIIAHHGPDAVAFYVSGQCLTEEYYVANKLVKGYLGTNNIDTNSRLCMSSAVSAYTRVLGEDAVPVAYDDIEHADCFLIAGANPAWCHPILFRRLEQHKEKNPDVKVIVVDPRQTESTSIADLRLPIVPGTDVWLYNAIARVLIESGDIDYEFIADHTIGFESYREVVFATPLEDASRICGVTTNDIRTAASWIGAARGFLTMWAMGLNQSVVGVKKNLALISLNLITGHIGKPGSGPFSLTGQPNAMGGREVGGLATMLAAHRSITNQAHREEVARFWGVRSISDKPGLTATEMISALEEGKLKALWIVCTNPMVSLPDLNRASAALRRARFVVVQDISRKSDTLEFADLILPAAAYMEKEGTMTNSERRITHLAKILDPPGEALPDAEILCMFARAMGFPGFDYTSPADIFAEHAALTRGTNLDLSGVSYERLKSSGSLQWPVPTSDHPGTPRLFIDGRFHTPDQRAHFSDLLSTTEDIPPVPDTRYPLILTTGRIRDQWHTMTKTGKVNKLRQHIDGPFLQIHPEDAAIRGIKEGDIVTVENDRGEARVSARVTESIRKGVVFLPMHWGKILTSERVRANNLTSSYVDPISKEPDFKFSAVEVKKFRRPAEKIVVIGAGAAAYRFLISHRALNMDDEIHIFSREEDSFYDRVLLPEYISGALPWPRLQKVSTAELERLNVTLHRGTEIIGINRHRKTVVDENGQSYRYDTLILATGSRANVPKEAPMHVPGVFTMRTRRDADELKRRIFPGGEILVIGGGLLGLELAASLRECDVDVSIVHLGSRLMERQIDALAGELLLDFVEEKGIRVHLNDEVQHIELVGTHGTLLASLKSGKTIAADAVIFAVGTRPNVEFIADSGLELGRGIIVNDYLQTSDPDIFAIGEIAEHDGKLYRITSAAEKQADAVASYLNGDLVRRFEGAVFMNILKFSDLDLCSIGMAEVPAGAAGYEEILFIDRAMRYYKKCIVKDDRLVGAILIGDKSEFAEFKSLIESRIELSDRRLKLLRSGKSPDPVEGRLVCSCNQVGEGNLIRLIQSGYSTVEKVCEVSGAGFGCGSCKPEVQRIVQTSAVNV